MTEPAIEAHDLALAFGWRTVLRVPSLAVDRGEALAVLGRNGAGKTTLLKACLGLHRPAAGRLSVLGQDVNTLGWWQLLRLQRRIGYVPQAMASGSEVPLTIREVVAMGRAAVVGLLRPLGRDDWRVVDTWLERVGLAKLANQRFREVSGGEQRKTIVARAMVQHPEILLLDEPTAWLDMGWREQIVQLLQDLYANSGMTIVLVCHELEVLPRCCQRVVLLADGTTTACGCPEDVLTDATVSAFYGGCFRVRHEDGRHAVLPACGGER